MKIEYMREMKRSYMTVKMEDWEIAESYERGMLSRNQITRSFKMKIKYTDGIPGIVMISLPVSLSAGYLKVSQQMKNR